MGRHSVQEYGCSGAALERDCTGFVDRFGDRSTKISVGGVIENSVAMRPRDHLQASVLAIRVVEIKQNCQRIAVCERVIREVLVPLHYRDEMRRPGLQRDARF